jgi:hypothetical protein
LFISRSTGNVLKEFYGKKIVSKLPDESRSTHAVTGKTVQADPQPVAPLDFATKLLRP